MTINSLNVLSLGLVGLIYFLLFRGGGDDGTPA